MVTEDIQDLHTLDVAGRDTRVRQLLSEIQPGEKLRFVVPYFKCTIGQSISPTFTELSFVQYAELADIGYAYVFLDPTTMNMKSDEARAFMVRHYWEVVSHLVVEMTKKEVAS